MKVNSQQTLIDPDFHCMDQQSWKLVLMSPITFIQEWNNMMT